MNEKKYHNGRKLGNRDFTVEELARIAVALGMEKKAFRPVLIDLKPAGAFTEYFAIMSTTSTRQARAVAEEIRIWFKRVFGMIPLAADGFETASWVLLDYGPLLVHVFQDPTREVYKLETLWSKGSFVDLHEEECTKLLKEANALVAAELPADETDAEPAE